MLLQLHTHPPPALCEGDDYMLETSTGDQCGIERGLCSASPHPQHDVTFVHTNHGYTMVVVSEWDNHWIIVCDDEYPCWLEEGEPLPPCLEEA
jgi:hypothetical protein